MPSGWRPSQWGAGPISMRPPGGREPPVSVPVAVRPAQRPSGRRAGSAAASRSGAGHGQRRPAWAPRGPHPVDLQASAHQQRAVVSSPNATPDPPSANGVGRLVDAHAIVADAQHQCVARRMHVEFHQLRPAWRTTLIRLACATRCTARWVALPVLARWAAVYRLALAVLQQHDEKHDRDHGDQEHERPNGWFTPMRTALSRSRGCHLELLVGRCVGSVSALRAGLHGHKSPSCPLQPRGAQRSGIGDGTQPRGALRRLGMGGAAQ